MTRTASLRQRAGVLTILVGLLTSLMAVVATPRTAFADEAAAEPTCETFSASPPGGGFYRSGEHVVIDTDTTAFEGGTATISGDNNESVHPANRMLVEVDGAPALEPFQYEVDPEFITPEFTVGKSLTVTLQVERVTSIESLTLCLTEPDVDPVASLSAGECTFIESSTYPVTYTLDINDGDTPFTLYVDDSPDTSPLAEATSAESLGSYPPGTKLEIKDDADVVWASLTVPSDGCPPPPPPPSPEIDLVKDPVVGAGSDLIDADASPPFLSFSSSDPVDQTAGYSYTITNTGDEPLVNLALSDDRIADEDLVLDCPEVLGVGDSCTATGSEVFTLAQAQADADGLVTNTGTVTADGQESGDEVTDTDPATIALQVVFATEQIEIDLVKEVVAGEGDVVDDDGLPLVSWSQDEFEAGESKTVRYRFTVTNVSDATIVDVELLDPKISDQPLIAVSDGVTLEPGESTVVEVDYLLSVDEAFPDGAEASRIDNVATVTGANETRDSFSKDSDDASVYTQVVFAEVIPEAGLDAEGLLPLSVLLMAVGTAVLWFGRRRNSVR